MSYYEPTLSFRISEFTDSVYIQGLIFSLYFAGYAAMALIIPYLSKCINHINLVTLGLVSCGVCNFFIGPSKLLPNSLILLATGLLLSGFTIVVALVPTLPIMLKRAEQNYPNDTFKASDL